MSNIQLPHRYQVGPEMKVSMTIDSQDSINHRLVGVFLNMGLQRPPPKKKTQKKKTKPLNYISFIRGCIREQPPSGKISTPFHAPNAWDVLLCTPSGCGTADPMWWRMKFSSWLAPAFLPGCCNGSPCLAFDKPTSLALHATPAVGSWWAGSGESPPELRFLQISYLHSRSLPVMMGPVSATL